MMTRCASEYYALCFDKLDMKIFRNFHFFALIIFGYPLNYMKIKTSVTMYVKQLHATKFFCMSMRGRIA